MKIIDEILIFILLVLCLCASPKSCLVIGGVAEALICTATGLFVAIPAVIAFNYFAKRVESFVIDMELSASELIDMIGGQSPPRAGHR